jgi:FkbM family methyltransferase
MSARQRLRAMVTSGLARLDLQLRRLPAPLTRQREAELRLKLEHAIALHLVENDPRDFFFIQVGAYDGVANDPLHDLVVRFKWRGILLEPQKEAFAALAENYRDQPQLILCNAAVAAESGARTLYKVRGGDPGLPAWAPQIASFRRDTVVRHRDVIPDIEERLETEEVECVRFDDLLAPFPGQAVDLLQIDAEGNDFEIIKLFHQGGRRARILHFEHKHLSRREHAECVAFLIDHGYAVGLDGGDSIACQR